MKKVYLLFSIVILNITTLQAQKNAEVEKMEQKVKLKVAHFVAFLQQKFPKVKLNDPINPTFSWDIVFAGGHLYGLKNGTKLLQVTGPNISSDTYVDVGADGWSKNSSVYDGFVSDNPGSNGAYKTTENKYKLVMLKDYYNTMDVLENALKKSK